MANLGRAGFLVALLAACGSGGGSSAGLQVEQRVDFGVVRPDVVTTIDVVVRNPLPDDAIAEEAQGVGDPFAVIADSLPVNLQPHGTFNLRFALAPPGPGPQWTEMRVRFRSAQQEHEIRIALLAFVETPQVALREPVLDFPTPLYEGETRTLTALVENRSIATPVVVTGFGSLPPEFSAAVVLPSFLVPGGSLPILVTYTPQAPGTHDFLVPIEHDAGDPLQLRIRASTEEVIPEITIDYGDVPLAGGRTAWLDVDTIYPTVSLSLQAVSADGTGVVELTDLVGPGGKVYTTETGASPLRAVVSAPGVSAVTAPNTDRSSVQLVPGAGRYRFRFKSSAGPTLSVRAILENRTRRIVEGGVVDLNVFSTTGIDGQGQRAQEILAHADEILAQVGLRIGAISYFELADDSYAKIADFAGLYALFRQSSLAPTERLNVFFVRGLLPDRIFNRDAIGISAAIPAPKRNGTAASGIAIHFPNDTGSIMSPPVGETEFLGLALAHEMGHCLGLYHTNDDIIDDTVDGCTGLPGDPCVPLGGGNLMWDKPWQYGAVNPILTPHQGLVLLLNPLVDPPPPALAGRTALAQVGVPSTTAGYLPPAYAGFCGNK